MDSWGALDEQPTRRVREEVKDGAAVVATSAVFSTVIAIAATWLTKLTG